jgi:ribose transport system permease protein
VSAAAERQSVARTSVWLRFRSAQRRFPIIQIVALGAVFLYGALTLPGLATWASIKTILVLGSLIGLASCGQTLLILMGGFDLSISGFLVASALMITTLAAKYHMTFVEALLVSVAACGLLGGIAGNICHRYEIQPLIVTLAMGAIAVGLVQAQTDGLTSGSAPIALSNFVSPIHNTFGIDVPPVVSVWILVIIGMALFIHKTPAGRRLMACGANPAGADLVLIHTRRVWTLAFAFSGVVSALVGVLVAGFAGSVDGAIGDPYLFESVVAVIVGGTVFGGPGDYSRSVLGALFLTVVTTVLVGHGAPLEDQQILYGLAILVAVALYGRQLRLGDRV